MPSHDLPLALLMGSVIGSRHWSQKGYDGPNVFIMRRDGTANSFGLLV